MFKSPVFIPREEEFEWAKACGQKVFDDNFLPPVEQGSNHANL